MPSKHWILKWTAVVFVLAVVGVACYLVIHAKPAVGGPPPDAHGEVNPGTGVSVEVTSPLAGGIDRVCRQPGTVEPFESAELYSKVAGFLIEQKVDIGSAVRHNQILAKIAVPEHEKQVKQDAADVARSVAKVDQMKAAIETAEADFEVAKAAIALAQAEQKSKASFRAYREKQRDRIKDLVDRMAIDAKLADEHEDQYQAAASADLAAGEAVGAARQKEAAARARINQARADLKYAEAEVATAKARLEKSQVLVEYATIRSPYTGVVTKRNFHVGDFIRSADTGGERTPMLVVERTDVMRVIIQVPERDVPFVDVGDPAIIEVDALPGVIFKTRGDEKVEISRMAASEDPHTRMMRTEVHVKNPDGKLRRGMYGRATLLLRIGQPEVLRIPSAALSGKADGEKGTVRVVRDDKVCIVPVRYGSDDGSQIEVLFGLKLADRVIVRASGTIEEGTVVVATEAKVRKSGH